MSERRALLVRLAPALLLVGLAAAWLLPDPGSLQLASADRTAADRWTAALDGLPDDPMVLIGFDPGGPEPLRLERIGEAGNPGERPPCAGYAPLMESTRSG